MWHSFLPYLCVSCQLSLENSVVRVDGTGHSSALLLRVAHVRLAEVCAVLAPVGVRHTYNSNANYGYQPPLLVGVCVREGSSVVPSLFSSFPSRKIKLRLWYKQHMYSRWLSPKHSINILKSRNIPPPDRTGIQSSIADINSTALALG